MSASRTGSRLTPSSSAIASWSMRWPGLEPSREDRVADVGGDVLGEVATTARPDVDRLGRHDSSIHVVLRSVNLSMACSDLSLPNPDCFTPPNGTVRSPSS